MAAHAIMAGEGDCFVAGGVETVSRYMHGAADTGPHNEIFADAETRTKERSAGGTDGWQPPAGVPDIYIAMGQTAENVVQHTGISRERQDEWGVSSQNRAEAALARGFFEREITPHPSRRHRGVAGRRHPPRHHSREGLDPRPGVPSRRHRHRRQRLPAQ